MKYKNHYIKVTKIDKNKYQIIVSKYERSKALLRKEISGEGIDKAWMKRMAERWIDLKLEGIDVHGRKRYTQRGI